MQKQKNKNNSESRDDMKYEKYVSIKSVLICCFVFLFIVVSAFFFVDWEKKEQGGQETGDNHTDRLELPDTETEEEREFAARNAEEIKNLKAVQEKLMAVLPDLAVTSRDFNRRLLSIIRLLQESEDLSVENWQKFRTDFAYEYEKMNSGSEDRKKLPKQVQKSEEEIVQILQELNQIIQRMHK